MIDEVLEYLHGMWNNPEARAIALRAVEGAAMYARRGLGEAMAEMKLTKETKAAIQQLKEHSLLWPAEKAVIVEPWARYAPPDKVRYDEHSGNHEVVFGVRMLNVAPFPVQLRYISVRFTIWALGRSDFSRIERPLPSTAELMNGDVHWETFAFDRVQGLARPPEAPSDLQCVVPVETAGEVLVRGPWDVSDQQVTFQGIIWAPLYVYLVTPS